MKPRARVLVVEDNDIVGEMLCLLLDTRFDISFCRDEDTAIAEITAQAPNVVLLDYFLRTGSGRSIAACAERAGAPVLWMTGSPEAMVALADEGRHFLKKPFHLDELLRALAELVRQNAATENAATENAATENAVAGNAVTGNAATGTGPA